MNLQEHSERIVNAEKAADVNRFRFGDILVWPLVRYHVLLQFKLPGKYFNNGEGVLPSSGFLRELAGALLAPVRSYRKRIFYSRFREELKQVPANAGGVLLFSDPKAHLDLIQNKPYNKVLDPFFEYFSGKRVKVTKLEMTDSDVRPDRAMDTFFFNKGSFDKYVSEKDRVNWAVQEKEIASLVERIHTMTGILLNRNAFSRQLRQAANYREMFRDLLGRLRPSCVFFGCYYTNGLQLGLLLACHDLKIRTVEIQHGKQGNYHPMYSHWTSVPAEGYAMLPDVFWNWGRESAENINKWLPPGCVHKAVTGGNLWLAKWKKSEPVTLNAEERSFLEVTRKYKKIILFTVQPIERDFFPDLLREAIEHSPDDWFWLIRLHPLHRKNPEITAFVKERKNTEMEFATRLPLYLLLKNVDHHLTCWSSVGVEALQFHVPTTIIHSTGKTIFADYIGQGKFTYASDGNMLLECIRSGEKKDVQDEYLVSDEVTIEKAMQVALGGCGIFPS